MQIDSCKIRLSVEVPLNRYAQQFRQFTLNTIRRHLRIQHESCKGIVRESGKNEGCIMNLWVFRTISRVMWIAEHFRIWLAYDGKLKQECSIYGLWNPCLPPEYYPGFGLFRNGSGRIFVTISLVQDSLDSEESVVSTKFTDNNSVNASSFVSRDKNPGTRGRQGIPFF